MRQYQSASNSDIYAPNFSACHTKRIEQSSVKSQNQKIMYCGLQLQKKIQSSN